MLIVLGDGKGIFEVVDEKPERCEEAAVVERKCFRTPI